MGLGFDFRRIEVDVRVSPPEVRVDGAPVRGWEFVAFELTGGRGPRIRSQVQSQAGSLQSRSQSQSWGIGNVKNGIIKKDGGGDVDKGKVKDTGTGTETNTDTDTDTVDDAIQAAAATCIAEKRAGDGENENEGEGEVYQVAVARYTGNESVTGHVVIMRGLVVGNRNQNQNGNQNENGNDWLSAYDAEELIERLASESR